MTRNDRDNINQRTENRHLLRRMKAGLAAVRTTPYKGALAAEYLLALQQGVIAGATSETESREE